MRMHRTRFWTVHTTTYTVLRLGQTWHDCLVWIFTAIWAAVWAVLAEKISGLTRLQKSPRNETNNGRSVGDVIAITHSFHKWEQHFCNLHDNPAISGLPTVTKNHANWFYTDLAKKELQVGFLKERDAPRLLWRIKKIQSNFEVASPCEALASICSNPQAQGKHHNKISFTLSSHQLSHQRKGGWGQKTGQTEGQHKPLSKLINSFGEKARYISSTNICAPNT